MKHFLGKLLRWVPGLCLCAAVFLLAGVRAHAYDPYDDPFWQDLQYRLLTAGGGVVEADATVQDGDYLPFFIVDALHGGNVTLRLHHCGRTFEWDGPAPAGLDAGKSYPFAMLEAAPPPAPLQTVEVTTGEGDGDTLAAELPAGWTPMDSQQWAMPEGGKVWFAGVKTTSLEDFLAGEWQAEADGPSVVLARRTLALPGGKAAYVSYEESRSYGPMNYRYYYCYYVFLAPGRMASVYFYQNRYDPAMAQAVFDPIIATLRPAS